MKKFKADDTPVHLPVGGKIIDTATFRLTASGYPQLVITFIGGQQLICTELGQAGEFDCALTKGEPA